MHGAQIHMCRVLYNVVWSFDLLQEDGVKGRRHWG